MKTVKFCCIFKILCYNISGDIMFYKSDTIFSKDIVSGKQKISGIHYHNSYELYFLINGTVKYMVDNKFFYLKPGDLIVIPPNILHSTDTETCLHNERLLLTFDEGLFIGEVKEYIDRLCENNIIVLPQEKIPLIEDMFYKVSYELNKNNELREKIIKLYISEIILYLYRYKYAAADVVRKHNSEMNKVSQYIFDNYSKNLSLNTLSKKFNFSQCHLSRKFKSETGVSLNQYINSVRISRAKDLLKKPFNSITQVAGLCGYNDSNYFTEVFKNLTGQTPLKYSKQYRQ